MRSQLLFPCRLFAGHLLLRFLRAAEVAETSCAECLLSEVLLTRVCVCWCAAEHVGCGCHFVVCVTRDNVGGNESNTGMLEGLWWLVRTQTHTVGTTCARGLLLLQQQTTGKAIQSGYTHWCYYYGRWLEAGRRAEGMKCNFSVNCSLTRLVSAYTKKARGKGPSLHLFSMYLFAHSDQGAVVRTCQEKLL